MKRLLITTGLMLVLSCPVKAADVTLTTTDAIELLNALRALDGYEKIVKEGQAEKTVKMPYTLSGGLRLLISNDIEKLKPIADAFDHARNGLVLQYAAGGKTGDVAFSGELLKMLEAPQTLDLSFIQDDELKLDINPIPASVLASLAKIRTKKP